MTMSPTLTESVPRLPLSNNLPGPTETTLPRCGFSFAVSGSTIPPAVRSSASWGSTTTRSSSGRKLTLAIGLIPVYCCVGLISKLMEAAHYERRLHHAAHATHTAHAHAAHATHAHVAAHAAVVVARGTFFFVLRDF